MPITCRNSKKDTCDGRTQDKSISVHSWGTTTHGNMIVYIAHGILAADTWTRIYALVSHASLRVRAIIVQYAFRATTTVRIPEIFHYASANSSVTLRIRPARCGCARIRFRQWNNCNNVAWKKKDRLFYHEKKNISISDGESYLKLWNTRWKDRRCNRANTSKSARDSRHYIRPLCRMSLDRDLCTSAACKPYWLGILRWPYILVYNLADCLCTLVNKNTTVLHL